MYELMTIPEVKSLSVDFAKAGIFNTKNADQAFALMMLCHADDINPVQAMRRFHLIPNRDGSIQITMRAEAMLADFQAHGGVCRWIQTDEEICIAEFSHPVTHPTPLPIEKRLQTYIDNGTAIGREGYLKENWKKAPDAMLRARAISAGIRAVLPAVITGIYATEEMDDRESAITTDSTAATPAVRVARGKASETKAPAAPAATATPAPVKEAPIEGDFTPVAPSAQDPHVDPPANEAPKPEAPEPAAATSSEPPPDPVPAPAEPAPATPVQSQGFVFDQALFERLKVGLSVQMKFFKDELLPKLSDENAKVLRAELNKAASDKQRSTILTNVACQIGWRAA
jgi:hypothetical protein